MKRMIRRWLGPDAEERENAAWRPAGSVTFLDVEMAWEAYPKLKRDAGQAMVTALRDRFVTLVSGAVETQGGVVSAAIGDSLLAVFTSAPAAVVAAADACRAVLAEPWPHGHPVRARFALYTGEAEREEPFDRYRGDALGYVLRLRDACQPGQIRMGERTAKETRDCLPSGISVIDDGDADIDRFPPERLYSVREGGRARL
jgi:class 3 adenylate cyclase